LKWETALGRIARWAACSGVSSRVARTRSATKPMMRAKNRVVAFPATSTSGWTSSTGCAWINSSLRTSAAIHWSEKVSAGVVPGRVVVDGRGGKMPGPAREKKGLLGDGNPTVMGRVMRRQLGVVGGIEDVSPQIREIQWLPVDGCC
jgi:hypothetical protein